MNRERQGKGGGKSRREQKAAKRKKADLQVQWWGDSNKNKQGKVREIQVRTYWFTYRWAP